VEQQVARKATFATTFRAAVRQVHLWLGLSAGLILALVGLSGAVLVFAEQMVKQEVPSFYHDAGPGEWRPVSEWVADAEKKWPDLAPIKFIFGPGSIPMPTGAPILFKNTEVNGAERHTLIPIDPVKGVAIERVNAEDTWAGLLVIFHKELLSEEIGALLVAICGVIGIVSVLTGVYMWWPNPGRWGMAFRFRRGARGAALLYDLHSVPAIWLLLPLALALATGLYMQKPDWVDPLVRVVSDVRDTPPEGVVSSPAGTCPKATTLDEAVAMARQGREDQILRHVYLPLGPNGVYDVEFRARDANSRADGDRIYVDKTCPKILYVAEVEDMTAGETAKSWAWPMHTDLLLGWTGKILLLLAGLSLPVLFVTGLLFWLKTRRSKAV
jgi:uncharacterized iron-regulated membrane protein